MQVRIKIFAILAVFSVTLFNFSCTRKGSMTAIIVTGQNSHNWQRSSIALRSILEKSGMFTVGITVSPEAGEDMSGFIIDFSPYDLVVLNYTGDDWPAETQSNFVDYVQNGGGVVVYHNANNSFSDWKEYNEIIGVGGWNGRDENAGPYIYISGNEVIRDNAPGRGGSHGSQHEFLIETYKPSHPILEGLPERWMHAQDELYSELRGPAKNMEILAYAYSEERLGGSGRDEPLLMTITYGKGRVFHTALGHFGGGSLFSPAIECAGFVTTFQRGAEWAATGKVTQEVPAVFPTETESLQWPFFEDIYSDITPIISAMQQYETGKSNDCFNIFMKLIRENIDNQQIIDEYHSLIRQLLKSRKTSVECKKILLKDFSWIADDSYRDIYEELKQYPELSGEAQYAIDRTGE